MLHRNSKRYLWKFLLHLLDVRMPVPSEYYLSESSRDEVRGLLQPGDIFLESNNAFPGSQIAAKLLFGTDWIHAGIYIGENKVIDSGRKPCVALNELDQFLFTTDLAIYRPQYLGPEDQQAAIAFANNAVGKPFNITLDDTHGHSFYCTQLIAEALLSMPHPIRLKHRHILWKSVVPPVALVRSAELDCIWSSSPRFFRNIIAHIPILRKSSKEVAKEKKSGESDT
ncbi:hypothetical protein BH10CYA1_BH10CYA1_39620 [soil metagenome]